jgi:hypothetical protein
MVDIVVGLRSGARGTDVENLQRYLATFGYTTQNTAALLTIMPIPAKRRPLSGLPAALRDRTAINAASERAHTPP